MVRSRAVMPFARRLARGAGPLLLLLVAEIAQSQSPSESVLDRAARARAAGDLAGARRILEEALAASPRDGKVAVALAETLIALGQFEPARDLLERLVRSMPDRPEPRRALALAYLNTDQTARALAEASKAAELDPKNPDSHLRLAQAQKAAGRYAEAVRSYQGVLRSRPREAAALHGLATAYAALEDPKAEETYQRLLAVAPDNLPLRVDFAEYLWQVGKAERGNEVMAAVVRDAPGNPRLRAHYGLNLVEQRRFVQAAEELEKAIAAGAGDYEALYFLGSALLEVGRFEDSAARFREAILLAPEKLPARHMLGRVLLLDGKEEAALPELEKAHELEPKSGAVLLDLGRAREATGKTAEAETAYRKALEAEPGLSRVHYALGTLLARLGRREEAREHVAIYQTAFEKEQATRLREASRRARLNLGWVELRQGRAERALEQFQRFPDDVEALRGAARALSKLGRHGEAAQTYERALAVSPEDPRLRYELDAERSALKKRAR